jgi:hypothetical protein
MSAFICSDMHINAIVNYAADKRISYWLKNGERVEITAFNAEEVGRILMAENVRSMVARYGDSLEEGERNADSDYRYALFPTPLTAVEVIKACHCLDYQSCETEDWETSLACEILSRIIKHATHDIPGYDDAPWEITDRTIGKLKHAGMTSLSALMTARRPR